MIINELKNRRLFLDGAMGSLLQDYGLKAGEFPELWNLYHPEVIEKIHLDYLEAGADVITANTFGVNGLKFKREGNESVENIVKAAVEIAKRAVKRAGHGYVALDMGPTGKLLTPYGTLEFEEACNLYKEVVRAGTAGADLILIETMGDSYELKAAVLAAKEESDLPVFASVTVDQGGKMLTGGDVESVVALLEGLGVDAVGLNCGSGPRQLVNVVKQMEVCASVPLFVNPNAGLPRNQHGMTVYDVDAEQFACAMKDVAQYASVLGGCCGTTPEHIKKTVEKCSEIALPKITSKERTVISSYSHAVVFGKRPVIIGERINPTGKTRLKLALKDHDLTYILNVAIQQQEARADVLDVNVGLPEIDEVSMMTDVVKELQCVTDLPLQIDTSNIKAMEQAMRIYNGIPLINSVNGIQETMDAVFPLVKHYGGVVVALCLDENGIPETACGRMAVAEKIYARAKEYGIEPKNILVDALSMAVSSDGNGARITLDTVRQIKEMGGKTILGISNVSFGLPMRDHINASFFLMALQEGLSAGIINPNSKAMMAAYDSFLVLSGQDENCERYIETYAESGAGSMTEIKPENENPLSALQTSVLFGLVQEAAQEAGKALLRMASMEIIDRELIPVLDLVGKNYEAGKTFLPQLLKSAEAAQEAFAVIKEHMKTEGREYKNGEKVILATVKGDVHDIGKNIVKVLLENYGFDVIDLGRDVTAEMILDTAFREDVKAVGLSSLMTTTVPAMERTIKILKEVLPEIKVIVGGAVMTADCACSIGADAYGKDAMDTVRYLLNITNL